MIFGVRILHLEGWKPPDASREVIEFDNWLLRENFAIEPQPAPFPVETQHPYRIVSRCLRVHRRETGTAVCPMGEFPGTAQSLSGIGAIFQPVSPGIDSAPRCRPGSPGPQKGYKWQWLRGLEEDANSGYDSLWRRTRSNYLGMLRLIDDQLGRLLSFLERAGFAENTVVVYLSDHGDYFCDYGLIHKGVGMPEDLIHVPMVWAGAGVSQQATNQTAFVSTADVMPTLCEVLGVEIPRGAQGRSLWPLLQGRPYPHEEFRSIYSEVGFGGMYYEAADHVPYSIAEFRSKAPDSKLGFDELDPVTQSGNLKMVRMGDWKLLFDMLWQW